MDSPTELVGFTSSRVARSVGVPIFPSALSQGVGDHLVLVKGCGHYRNFSVFPPSLETSSIEQNQENSVRGVFVSTADVPLLDCALRLARLLDTPQDIPILAPMIIREIYYRLLIGEQSEAVRQIAISGSNMQRIAEAIQLIKTDFTQALRVGDLAAQARMSPSSFYQHFKQVTSMSPIQYQKQLRLLEARRLMLAENSDAASAAHRVGYESHSQFSREYSRMFGAPPRRDIVGIAAPRGNRLRTA